MIIICYLDHMQYSFYSYTLWIILTRAQELLSRCEKLTIYRYISLCFLRVEAALWTSWGVVTALENSLMEIWTATSRLYPTFRTMITMTTCTPQVQLPLVLAQGNVRGLSSSTRPSESPWGSLLTVVSICHAMLFRSKVFYLFIFIFSFKYVLWRFMCAVLEERVCIILPGVFFFFSFFSFFYHLLMKVHGSEACAFALYLHNLDFCTKDKLWLYLFSY